MGTCRLCNKPTNHPAAKLCDRCWELESRITSNPGLAIKILKSIDMWSTSDGWKALKKWEEQNGTKTNPTQQ
jgi:hypothetical protein